MTLKEIRGSQDRSEPGSMGICVPSFPPDLEAATQGVRQKMAVGPALSSQHLGNFLSPWRWLGGVMCGFML